MRYSIPEALASNHPEMLRGVVNTRVFLDGFLQRHCFEADNTLNYVRRYKTDKHGRIVFDKEDMAVVETRFGSVWIEEEKP